MDLGMGEILLILVFALLVYGGRLPEVARSLGRAIATVKQNLMATQTAVTSSLEQAAETPDDDRPRTVRRIAPPELAKEDVSGTPAAGEPAPPAAPDSATNADAAAATAAAEPPPTGTAETRPPGPSV